MFKFTTYLTCQVQFFPAGLKFYYFFASFTLWVVLIYVNLKSRQLGTAGSRDSPNFDQDLALILALIFTMQ